MARARDNVVLAVSIPASELEMTAEDQSDFERFKKLLDRLGKAIIMSAEAETSEIIRRRLFEWGGLPKEAIGRLSTNTLSGFRHNKQQLPSWFPVENAREAIEAGYPFHPSVLSVFERKWQGLPQFQQTRGVLRLLALWVRGPTRTAIKGAHKDPLISLGTAPLDDTLFRAAVFEQLGEPALEAAVTTDIAGKEHAHALRLDAEATRGGQEGAAASQGRHRRLLRVERRATARRSHAARGAPGRRRADLDIGNVEQCLEALTEACYFLTAEKNSYRFSFQAEPEQAARRPTRERSRPRQSRNASEPTSRRCSRRAVGVERMYFPEKSNEFLTDRHSRSCVLHPDQSVTEPATRQLFTQMTAESGSSSRTSRAR